jgi:hypothetical protein
MRLSAILVSVPVLLVSTLALAQAPAAPAPAAPGAPAPPAPGPPPGSPQAQPAPAQPQPSPPTAPGLTPPAAPNLTLPPSPFPAVPPASSGAQGEPSRTIPLVGPSVPPSREPTAPAPAPPPSDKDVDVDTAGQAGARVVGLPPPNVNYSNFMDTRLSWTFGTDDVLHPTGQLIPLSPSASIGDRAQYQLFFDALDSRFNGRENLSHLVVYKKMPGFLPHLTTEAAVVLAVDFDALGSLTGNLNSAFYDAGSYIRLFYNTNSDRPREGISAVFFPIDTDRFRLGYLYNLSWGGTDAALNQSIFPSIVGSAPGLKVQYDHDKFYAFAGFKTAQIVEPIQIINPGSDNDVENTSVANTNYGFLAGFGLDPFTHLRIDGGAGYFQQGRFDLDDVRGRPVYTYGFSGRVVVHDKMPIPQSVDFLLYKNDPMAPMTIFAPERYNPREVAWSVSLEADQLFQHLKNFDVTGGVEDQPATALALQGVLRLGYARFSATGIYQDLNYVEHNVPGFIPFETIPQSATTQAEIFGALAFDYYVKSARLTPGIAGGLELPSTFQSVFTDGGIPASRTIVVREQGNESILPYDDGRRPIFQGRIQCRWDISDMLKAFVWVQYVNDNNGTLVVTDPNEGSASLRVFQPPGQLGFATSLQARF